VLAVVMIGLGVLYIAQDAPFLGVQIIVYTGAIMMLFLFVVMLVGVDASDSLVETLRDSGCRRSWPGLRLRRPARRSVASPSVCSRTRWGWRRPTPEGNGQGLAGPDLLAYVFAFEATAAC
jgi:NADH-quinone oxidoreductase subunit J